MKRDEAPRTLGDHINHLHARMERVERRPAVAPSSFEFYAQPDPPATAGYSAFWLDTAP